MATVDEPTVVLGTEQSTCERCGSPLAADQRYCVVCGTRRGPSTLPDAMRGSSGPQRPRRGSPPPKTGGSTSPALTILAFIGALLLAMGVGILIGRSTNSNSKPQKVQVVTVGDGAGSGASTGTPATSDAATQTATSATQSAATSSSAAHSAAAAAGGAATHASGTVTKATVSATHSTASSTSKTKPGYNSKGQFTGNFFGG